MAKKNLKNKPKVTRINNVTKTSEPVDKLIVQELNVMSADRSYKDIGSFKQALQSAESVHYPNRVRLYDLYNDIMLDGHLTGIIEKRVDEVINKDLVYQTREKERVKLMDDVIESNPFREVCKQVLLSMIWGISGMEFIPGAKLEFKEIPRKHIKSHKKVIAHEQNGEEGKSYEGVSNIWVIGKDDDLGLLLKCSMYALWKRGNMGDWAQYIEIFGQPVRIIYYDAYDTKTKEELRKVLDESGSSLAMMIPKQAQFDMKDGKQSNGNGELQEKFKVVCDNEMSIAILGNTETTTSSKSSGYAQSKEHGKQQLQKTKSDIKFLQNYLNDEKFIAILRSYGLPVVDGGKFVFEKEIDPSELKLKAETEKIVMETYNPPVDHDYVYTTYGIPKPKDYDVQMAKREADKMAIQGKEDPANPEPSKEEKYSKKENKKPLKKNLQSEAWFIGFREFLADFFDPAH